MEHMGDGHTRVAAEQFTAYSSILVGARRKASILSELTGNCLQKTCGEWGAAPLQQPRLSGYGRTTRCSGRAYIQPGAVDA